LLHTFRKKAVEAGMDDEVEWLDSNTTMTRVASVLGEEQARLTIAGRAHDGLIRTRADRFVAQEKSLNNFDIPSKFWWAGGHEALEQNWISGDFSTWIENRAHWKAYGVRFCAADIDKLIPEKSKMPDQPAIPASDQAVDKEIVWVSSRLAVERITRAIGEGGIQSLYAIIAYAKTGHIRAKALSIRTKIKDRFQSKTHDESDANVPLWFWENCTGYDSSALNWQSGVFAGNGHHNGNSISATLTGVQFASNDLDLLDPPAPIAEQVGFPGGITAVDREYDPNFSSNDADVESKARRPSNKVGRQAAEWWDDLWIEICRQLYVGDLKPKKQVDIELAMQNWVYAHGGSAAVSTIRERARKLWAEIQREDEI
tara:strand:+ start:7484 stop:8596 length:1113 start_codon:yes stop_codon:yes gene_type:complete